MPWLLSCHWYTGDKLSCLNVFNSSSLIWFSFTALKLIEWLFIYDWCLIYLEQICCHCSHSLFSLSLSLLLLSLLLSLLFFLSAFSWPAAVPLMTSPSSTLTKTCCSFSLFHLWTRSSTFFKMTWSATCDKAWAFSSHVTSSDEWSWSSCLLWFSCDTWSSWPSFHSSQTLHGSSHWCCSWTESSSASLHVLTICLSCASASDHASWTVTSSLFTLLSDCFFKSCHHIYCFLLLLCLWSTHQQISLSILTSW